MNYLISLASVAIALFSVLAMHPFQNIIVNAICFSLLNIVWFVLVCVAGNIEDRYKKRIENLEKEVETLARKSED